MKYFSWNNKKNRLLKSERNISFEEIAFYIEKKQVLDIIEERLSEIEHISWVVKGNAFQFLQAATVVFDTGVTLNTPKDFIEQLPKMSMSSIYYHFVEARRRTNGMGDDFTVWLSEFGDEVSPLLDTLKAIDFYFLSLKELKNTLVAICSEYTNKFNHEENTSKL